LEGQQYKGAIATQVGRRQDDFRRQWYARKWIDVDGIRLHAGYMALETEKDLRDDLV